MTANDNIPWKRLSVEAAAIVVSILLAFSIDAWWEDRKERAFEQETLLDLKAEYEDHLRAIEGQKEFHLESLRAIGSLMSACQSGFYRSSEFSIDDAIILFLIASTTDLGSGVRDSLISGGRIEVLRDGQLRHALFEWDSVVDELTDNQLFSRAMVRETVIPYLTKTGVPLSGAMDGSGKTPWPIPTQSISSNPDAFSRLLKDPEFCSLLDVRYGRMNHTLDEFDNLLVAIHKLLVRIRASVN